MVTRGTIEAVARLTAVFAEPSRRALSFARGALSKQGCLGITKKERKINKNKSVKERVLPEEISASITLKNKHR